jgi:phage tail sheath protein FI
MQPRSNSIAINAITNINPYGLTIWGNRTLKPVEENLVATNFLNIRNLISDIKKTCYRAARKATFEQDTDVLWINFKSDIAKLLDRMKSGYGISGYKIVRDYDHEKSAENATLCAKIVIYPTYAVEDFYITVILRDDEVTVQ